ncbi:MAG: proton-conducting transporter membrane subunit, partial [Verrucomicrobiales bacterium]
RRLLAYSAVANTGYLLVGVCGNGALSSGTALFYVLVYGLGTFGAFAVTAGVERETGSDSVESFAGLVKRSPMLALALLVCLASLAGIPPLAGFAGKFAMFSAALKEGMSGGSMPLAWLVGLAAVMSAISLYYYISVLKQAFVREPVSGSGCKLPVAHVLTVVVPAVALVVLGLFPGLLMDPIADAVAGLLAMK